MADLKLVFLKNMATQILVNPYDPECQIKVTDETKALIDTIRENSKYSPTGQ
jgi:hypothetical protein